MFNGNCQEALDFYLKVFGAEVTYMQRYGDFEELNASEAYKDKILHCSIEFEGNTIYMSDKFEESPEVHSGNISLSLNFESERHLTEIYEKLKEDGEIKMPLQDTFWNAKFASLKDKYGIEWSLNCFIEDLGD
jgi:PhnB protein